MEHIEELLRSLNELRPETLRLNAFACYASTIAPVGSLDGAMLGRASVELAKNAGFDCRFHFVDEIATSELARRPPDRGRFENDDEWEEAVFYWETSPKPWLRVRHGSTPTLIDYLTRRLVWTINSRRYVASRPKTLLGRFQSPRFDPPKEHQDKIHSRFLADLANSVAKVVGDDADVYDTNHLLDLNSVDRTTFEWDCFYDETIACVGPTAIVLIWLGHTRHYG